MREQAVEGGAGFSKEHCKPADAVASGARYEHVLIFQSTTAEVAGTNQKTGPETNTTSIWKLKATLNGVTFELSAEGGTLGGAPWMEDERAENGEHIIYGVGQIHFAGVKVTKPAGTGCTVYADENESVCAKETSTSDLLTATTILKAMY